MPMMISDADQAPCGCCGQMRPYPTRAGLWEYLQDPRCNPDGSLMTQYTSNYTEYDKGKPVNKTRIVKVDQAWQRVSIVDVSHITGGDFHLLIVPVGMLRPIWWPNRTMWRKVGDQPEIDWRDVIYDDRRLGDCEFNENGTIKKWGPLIRNPDDDEEDEAAAEEGHD